MTKITVIEVSHDDSQFRAVVRQQSKESKHRRLLKRLIKEVRRLRRQVKETHA